MTTVPPCFTTVGNAAPPRAIERVNANGRFLGKRRDGVRPEGSLLGRPARGRPEATPPMSRKCWMADEWPLRRSSNDVLGGWVGSIAEQPLGVDAPGPHPDGKSVRADWPSKRSQPLQTVACARYKSAASVKRGFRFSASARSPSFRSSERRWKGICPEPPALRQCPRQSRSWMPSCPGLR